MTTPFDADTAIADVLDMFDDSDRSQRMRAVLEAVAKHDHADVDAALRALADSGIHQIEAARRTLLPTVQLSIQYLHGGLAALGYEGNPPKKLDHAATTVAAALLIVYSALDSDGLVHRHVVEHGAEGAAFARAVDVVLLAGTDHGDPGDKHAYVLDAALEAWDMMTAIARSGVCPECGRPFGAPHAEAS